MAAIEPFIHRRVVVLHQDASARQAALAMCERSVGCVFVSDHEGHIIGILTDRDLTCRLTAESAGVEIPIARVMSTPVIRVNETDEVERVIQLMTIHGIRRIPVMHSLLHGREKCVGIVTLDDLIASRTIDEYHLIRIVRSQLLRKIGHDCAVMEPVDFYREVAARAEIARFARKNKAVREQAQEIIQMILKAFVQRLHPTGALYFISELPLSLQEELMEGCAGPDRTLSVARVNLELQELFDLDAGTACGVLTGVCYALEQILDYERLGHVKAQLPQDFRNLFEGGSLAA